jgi:hypothetical protein
VRSFEDKQTIPKQLTLNGVGTGVDLFNCLSSNAQVLGNATRLTPSLHCHSLNRLSCGIPISSDHARN